MNFDDLKNSVENLSTPDGKSTTQPGPLSKPSWTDAPLDTILEFGETIMPHEMTDEELLEYVKRAENLRASSQTRKAALNKEATALGVEKKKKKPKSAVDEAMALLASIKGMS